MTAAAPAADPLPEAPGVGRRLASFLYEGVLLFGVVMIAGYLYSSLTQQRHALQGTLGLQLFLFVVLGIYFVWFWSHGGQTVAMKTWHIRVVDRRRARADAGACAGALPGQLAVVPAGAGWACRCPVCKAARRSPGRCWPACCCTACSRGCTRRASTRTTCCAARGS